MNAQPFTLMPDGRTKFVPLKWLLVLSSLRNDCKFCEAVSKSSWRESQGGRTGEEKTRKGDWSREVKRNKFVYE